MVPGPRPRRGRRNAAVAGGGLALVAVASLAGIALHYSHRILGPDKEPALDTEIVYAVTDSSVVLSRNPETILPGVYYLRWRGQGYGLLGPVRATTDSSVERMFQCRRGHLAAPGRAAFCGYPNWGDPRTELGIDWQDVAVPSGIGPLPSWFIPGHDSTWAVFVHGRAATRAEGLRAAATLRRLGAPCLLISYRNDGVAPRVGNGSYRLGGTEWQDVEAGVRYCLDHGARGVVLVGLSMGGGVVLECLKRSALANRVVGAVLDGPVVDWRRTILFNGAKDGVPLPIVNLGLWTAAQQGGVDWSELDQDAPGRRLTQPILLFHGDADRTVPFEPSAEFAAHHGDHVTFVPVHGVGHVRAWNANPAAYDSIVAVWWVGHVR